MRTQTIERGDSLGEPSDLYYGDNNYGVAILLAANGRVAEGPGSRPTAGGELTKYTKR